MENNDILYNYLKYEKIINKKLANLLNYDLIKEDKYIVLYVPNRNQQNLFKSSKNFCSKNYKYDTTYININ